jgi:hypothetical protein
MSGDWRPVADHHRAAVGVEAELGIVVADLADRLAGDARVIVLSGGGDFTGHDDEPGRNERLGRDPRRRVLL